MSQRMPSWVKNVLIFGGISAFVLLNVNKAAAQQTNTENPKDSIANVIKSNPDSLSIKNPTLVTNPQDTTKSVPVINTTLVTNPQDTTKSVPVINTTLVTNPQDTTKSVPVINTTLVTNPQDTTKSNVVNQKPIANGCQDPKGNANKNSSSNPCGNVEVFSTGGSSTKNKCVFYISNGSKAHEK